MVTELVKSENSYQAAFRTLAPTVAWLELVRGSAMDRFEQLGFPSVSDEEWKYTNLASLASPNFQGYVIAVCNFQYAHGFAFVSDLGARNLAMGYLALVIPDPTSSGAGRGAFPDPCGGASTIAGCAATGENLGN